MRIGILSDTHRNRALHEEALDHLLQRERVTAIYHLGDDYKDAELELERGIEVVRVPGIYCPEYRENTVNKIVFETVHGINIVLCHDESALTYSIILTNDVFLYGHSHKAGIKVLNGKLFLNPGHMKADKDKGRPPSFGVLEIDYGEVSAFIKEFRGQLITSVSLRKGANGLYKT